MLPNPLHPAVVHFPIVLMFLLPLAIITAIWSIRGGARVGRAWAVPTLFAAALVASAWVSLETGEDQEERVERVVPESAIDGHKDRAQLFLIAAGTVLLVTAGGFAPGRLGRQLRWAAGVGACGVAVAGIRVGHSGGTLVYQHGAASVYVTDAAGGGGAVPGRPRGDDDRGR